MKYGFEWTPGLVLLGVAVVFPLAAPFAMIAVAILALAALAALVLLAGAVLASPYLLVRSIRRRHAEWIRSTEASGPVPRVIPGMATHQPSMAALAHAAVTRGSR